MAISLIVADDHPVFRHGLRALLEKGGYAVVGEASDGYEALKVAQQMHPDIVLLDFSMPRLNGLDAAREIIKASPRSKIILLTAHREEQYVQQALQAGVRGYVLKSEATATLLGAVQEVFRGNAFLSPGISRVVAESVLARSKSGAPAEILSPRELQVLQLIVEGNTTKEVAQKLNLTVKTAESYRTGLMNKLDIHETAGLVRYAVRRGLIKP
jgi:DNA-binding NarL/FixJ family response regulator